MADTTPTPTSTPAPAPAQNPQVVSSGSGGMDWKKIITVVVIIIGVTAIITGAYWYFVIQNGSSDSDLTGPVPTVNISTATPSATESATASADHPHTGTESADHDSE